MHRLLLYSIHHALIVSRLLVHNNKQNYCKIKKKENIHLLIKLHIPLDIKKGKNEQRC